ncbi:MAG: hypothetical protein MUF49_03970 [Oculatellaceae cyanobacterium Prado106]|nr:hypothetical protein [Oculatellaceae cyanobacterium Prado106]
MTAIASQFTLFECVECAAALRHFLTEQDIPGIHIKLFTGTVDRPLCNIYCDTIEQVISLNGRHEAIAIEIDGQEKVFDNIYPQGISRVEWLESFHSPVQDLGLDFQITETFL